MTKFTLIQLEYMEQSIKRELAYRRYWYPLWVKDQNKPTFTEKKAANEITLMEKTLELIQEQKATKPKDNPTLFEKRPGILVQTVGGKKGIVYNDDPKHEDKLKVVVTGEDFQPTCEKILVAETNLTVVGYAD